MHDGGFSCRPIVAVRLALAGLFDLGVPTGNSGPKLFRVSIFK